MLSLNATLLLLGLCCVTLLVGFSYREQRWAPWVMLVASFGLVGLMSYGILALLPGA